MKRDAVILMLGLCIGLVLGAVFALWIVDSPPAADDPPQIIMQYTHTRT